MTMTVSVVIPTCRRPDLLARCLAPLLEQSLTERERYEVIVVDDGRTDETRTLVERMAETPGAPRLRYLRPAAGRGPAAARNLGWQAAEGEIVAFTDDDTVPDRDWLRAGVEAMEHLQVPAVRGQVRVPLPRQVTDHARMTQGLEVAEFVTANCFVRHDALQAVGGFDERFTRPWREDSDLHFKLIGRYGEVPKASRAVVQHPVREAPFGISLKQQANMMFDALLFKKHPQLYERMVGRLHAPASYYAIVGATLAAPVAARRLRGTTRAPRNVVEMLLTSAAIPFLSLYWRLAGAWRFRVRFF